MDKLTFKEFAKRYCERQEQTPEGLKKVLKDQIKRFNPDGFMLLEAQLMDSSWFGQLTILPYGPNNSFKTIPDHPISPRGLASDTSIVVATLDASEVK